MLDSLVNKNNSCVIDVYWGH